ncbi:zinc dependent phospholipase C family protein [Alkalibacter mobilis]|uniref:zinc dependent phospholipase C family protein n=1 Tax=Alkalibacter mobilis TaxID=2787712 RepID=UPI00189DC351|nr:zinc dependent phospholipase C family protein [Alkalibacter mobilis]MBF7097748.1 zinc dependent phospholipase C family protein [Alkalibacter mobilis]
MKLKSHITIASKAAEILEEHLDISIDRNSLELGAIYPDVNFFRRIKLHNINEVHKNFVIQSKNFINRTNKLTLSFSLGMLSHYVCDAFCHPHNKKIRSYSDFKDHVAYELVLAKAVENFELKKPFIDKLSKKLQIAQELVIKDFIEDLRTEYLYRISENKKIQCRNDIEFSVHASTIIMIGLIISLQEAQCPELSTIMV